MDDHAYPYPSNPHTTQNFPTAGETMAICSLVGLETFQSHEIWPLVGLETFQSYKIWSLVGLETFQSHEMWSLVGLDPSCRPLRLGGPGGDALKICRRIPPAAIHAALQAMAPYTPHACTHEPERELNQRF